MIAQFNIDYAQGFYIGRPDGKLRPLDVPHPVEGSEGLLVDPSLAGGSDEGTPPDGPQDRVRPHD